MSQAKVDRYKEEKRRSACICSLLSAAGWLSSRSQAGLVCPVTASMRARSRLRPFTPMSMPSPIT